METIFDFLKCFPFLPSRESKGKGMAFASNSEKRRWIERGSVEVDGEKFTSLSDPWPFSNVSVVIHPKSQHRTTLQ